jgi:hypothetical protein
MKNLFVFIFLLPCLLLAQNTKPILLTVSEITVKPGHNSQFLDGVKKWKECYLENNGTDSWNMWKRVQGVGNVYVLTGVLSNWAEMDKEDPASKACQLVVTESIYPHVESNNFAITNSMPEVSRSPLDGMKMVWVTFFQVKNSRQFMDVIKEVSGVHRSSKGQPLGMWYDYAGGGPNDADYMVSTPYLSYADMDKEQEGPWEVYAAAQGEKKAKELREKFVASISDSWAYLYALNSELSHQ